MTTYISDHLRQQVAPRANFLCEYCLLHEDECYLGCEVDHVISLKHSGPTALWNLGFACMRCNRRKGTDISSINWQTGSLVRFFNPRRDQWAEHFQLSGAHILPRTEIGEATIRIFGFNEPKRIQERELLWRAGMYPSAAAMEIIGKSGDTI